MKNTDEYDDFDLTWATNFSKKMTKFGEKMNKLGKDLTESSSTLFDGFDGLIQNCTIDGDVFVGDTSIITKNGKTTIKKGNTKIVIDKDGNVTVNGKKVENEKEEEKKPKFGDLEKLVDIPKIDNSDLFRNIPTKICVDENLTTPLTLAHLDKYELKLTNLESKLGGRIEKLFMAVAIIGMMSLATLVSLCMSL